MARSSTPRPVKSATVMPLAAIRTGAWQNSPISTARKIWGVKQRLARRGGGDDEAHGLRNSGGRSGDDDFSLRQRGLKIAAAFLGAIGIAAPQVNLAKVEDLGVHTGLQSRLNAGAED